MPASNLYDTLADAWRYECDYAAYGDDLPLIAELCRASGGRVLELGAGTGRVAIHLARQGIDVTALEKCAGMIEVFKKKLEAETSEVVQHIRVVEDSAESASFSAEFSIVLFTFNFLQLIPDESERSALLSRVHSWLLPGGSVYIELSTPFSAQDVDCTERVYVREFFDTNQNAWARLYQSCTYVPASRSVLITYDYVYDFEDGAWEVRRFVTVGVVNPPDLIEALARAGFAASEKWGGYDKEPYEENSPNFVVLAKKILAEPE